MRPTETRQMRLVGKLVLLQLMTAAEADDAGGALAGGLLTDSEQAANGDVGLKTTEEGRKMQI